MAPLPRLELVCFGPPTASVDGRVAPPEVLWPKHFALLVYLALAPRHRRARSHLRGLLWAERPEARARHALNEAVSRLRRSLGPQRIQSHGDALELAETGLEVDALRVASLGDGAADRTLGLLRGDFLEGFYIDDAPAFEEWMESERRRLRALTTAVLVTAGEEHLGAGRLTVAGDLARRALDQVPHCEPAASLLMRTAALAGDTPTALATHETFRLALEREGGQQPSKSLSSLAARLRSGAWQPAGVRAAVREPALVGRTDQLRSALETVRRALADGPRTLVISGMPGMGRTRLMSECLRRLALDGACVSLARPIEADQDAPWSALRRLVDSGLADAPGLPAAHPDALGALADLVPRLAERFPPRAVRDVADMAAALAASLAAVAVEVPVAVALDDAQWADGASLAALRSAVATLRGAPVMLIVTVALGAGKRPRELLQLQTDIGGGLPGLALRLDPLSDVDVRALVEEMAMWCREDAERDRLARRLAFETAGSPFFAVTVLRALQRATALRPDLTSWPPPRGTLDAPLPFSVPGLVRLAVALRVGDLAPAEQTVLRAASVGGQLLDLELIAALSEQTGSEVEQALPEFERRDLIHFDGHRYTFRAPLVAEAVLSECVTRGERRRLEQRAVAALASRADLESRVRWSELLARIDPNAESLAQILAVAQDAVRVGAGRVARRALAAAEAVSRNAALDRSAIDVLLSRVEAL